MKVRILTFILLALFAGTSMAAAEEPNSVIASEFGQALIQNVAVLIQELDLSDEQIKQITKTLKKTYKEAGDTKLPDVSTEDGKKKALALLQSTGAAVLNHLTPDQQAKIKSLPIASIIANPKKALPKVIDDLKLDEIQQVSAIAVVLDAREQIVAIYKDASLDASAKKKKWMQLANDGLGKLITILTPEQQQKLLELTRP